jgi:threonine aldolase
MSALGGIQPCPIPNRKDGTLALDDIRASIRSEDVHHPITRLVCLENTQNVCGGVPLTAEYTRQVGELAHENELFLHIDGARIFNAAAAQNADVKELVAPADSVMFCLSKGLVSPIGSMLVGTRKFIARARHIRKMLGGGMRQVGVIAAAGIIALEKMTKRLGEDHARARKLAEGLRGVRGIVLDAGTPHTNMVYFNLADDVPFDEKVVVEKISNYNVLVDWADRRRFRLVTHYWVDDDAVKRTIQAFENVLG